MASKRAAKRKAAPGDPPDSGPWPARVRAALRRWLVRGALAVLGATVLLVALFAVLNPPTTPYIWSESRRLDGVAHDWVDMADVAPVMARAAVAAEDANFCLHWGLDISAIRAAMADGGRRGASTISQQTVKNVYLWQGRSWTRKSIEALVTPLVEALWSKRRILEVYLNVVEFDAGVFGVDAAAQHYFGIPARDLDPVQAARLAAVLPDPKGRSAARPSDFVRRRAASIRDGAATIRKDGRAECFER